MGICVDDVYYPTTMGTQIDLMDLARAAVRYIINDNTELNVAFDYQRDDLEARADTLIGIGRFTPGVAAWDRFMFDGTDGNGHLLNPNFHGYGVHYDSRFLPPNPYVSHATFDDPYSGLRYQPRTALTQKGVSATLSWRLTDSVNAKLIAAWRKPPTALRCLPDRRTCAPRPRSRHP